MLTNNTTGVITYSKKTRYEPAEGSWVIDGEVRLADPDRTAYTYSENPPTVTPVECKMLFTSQERIAIRSSVDPVIVDFMDLLNDPRLHEVDLSLKSINDLLDYMTATSLIGAGRKAEILTGVVK